jgi:hypothetical protein
MDSARFGRVLGIGTRLAGKTIVQAVDAAASPNPRASTPSQPEAPQPPAKPVTLIRPTVARATASAKATTKGVARGGKRFGEAIWGPLVRSGKVLWLEVTGVFFGLVSLFGAQGLWLHRAGLHASATSAERQHVVLSAAMAVVFGYFCISSFHRAARKNRG